MRVDDFSAIRIKLASPQEILSWSKGEVTKPETINYRTQRAEKDGLFCEKIFGPERDYNCYCGKYKGIRYKGIICDRCGVEVTKSLVRRERMGHIKLANPCAHIWFLRGVPSRIGMVLDLPMEEVEKVIYYAGYIITEVREELREKFLAEIEREYKSKVKAQSSKIKDKKELEEILSQLKEQRDKARKEILSLKPLKVFNEAEYRRFSLKYAEIFEAGTGSETLRKIFEKIDLEKEIEKLKKSLEKGKGIEKKAISRRLKLFQGLFEAKIRPEWMFLTVLPVLPPELRPMVQLDGGRYASSDLNDLYRRVINRNNRLKYLLEIKAPEVIIRNEKRMLQEAVDALIDNGMRKTTMIKATTGGKRLLKSLADMLKGKQGRFRQNLLGKRVDYSGRSVIVVGPELKLNQVGLPKKMALELFKPFVIRKILEKELAYNVRMASRLIEEEREEVWAILEEVVKDKLVLLNRAPTLHRLSIQAFYPILIEGESIKIHPMVCRAYNADFDGDQMAVFLPLSQEAQKEAKEIVLSHLNLLKPATGTSIVTLYQDIVLGCYFLTTFKEGARGEGKIFSSPEEALLAYEFGQIDLRAKIKFPNPKSEKNELIESSAGRFLFNNVLPKDYPFWNEVVKIQDLEEISSQIINQYSPEKASEILDKIKELGFEASTWAGVSWGIDDLNTIPQKKKIIQEAEKRVGEIENYFKNGLLSWSERTNKIIEIWTEVKGKIEKLVLEAFPKENSVFMMIDAGAKGSWSQVIQMAGIKGLVINPLGQTIELPIKHSFKEGFDVLEYFISTHGARKGTVDTALRTSTAGYLTRRLVDVSHEVLVFNEDCGDEKGIEISKKEAEEINQNFLFKIVGRFLLQDIFDQKNRLILKKGEIIDWQKGKEILASGIEKVRVRSPLSCKEIKGVCQKCYGWDLGRNKLVQLGEAVGIVAAQAIGEPGTQLTMKTFHTGGVAGGADITFGLPKVEELFEARVPTGKAEISPLAGRVEEIKNGIVKIKAFDKKRRVYEIKVSSQSILVKENEEVQKGQPLTEGTIDPHALFQLLGREKTQNYLLKEIQKIYVNQGALIHDKHIEVILRQMFSRMKILESNDSSFIPGEIVEKAVFLEDKERLRKKGKRPAKAEEILLGISRVALTTSSFLSAASFQETSRILIRAALEGREDRLFGLKENVIIGKIIPSGTGFNKR